MVVHEWLTLNRSPSDSCSHVWFSRSFFLLKPLKDLLTQKLVNHSLNLALSTERTTEEKSSLKMVTKEKFYYDVSKFSPANSK